ncbi:hypothetical protein PoB_004176200, partial [Plakobranchus ocellatus]
MKNSGLNIFINISSFRKFFVVASFILLAVLLLINISFSISFSIRSTQSKDEVEKKQRTLDMYKAFFKTESEMVDMMKMMHTQGGRGWPERNTPLVTPKALPVRDQPALSQPAASNNQTYHGCCTMNQTRTTFDSLHNIYAQKRKIVQRYNNRSQYFLVDNC